MTLPVNTIVKVGVTIAPTLPSKKGFGIAALVSDEVDLGGGQQSQRVLYYADIAGVGVDWAPTSETYLMAQTYFSQNPSPDKFATIAHYITGANAFLFGGSNAETDILIWNAESNGGFRATIDAVTTDVLAIDTSGAVDLPAVAALIETALQATDAAFAAATITWNTTLLRFEMDSGVAGGTIAFLQLPGSGNDISVMLDMTSAGLAVLQQGVAVESSVVDALTAAELFDDEWYGFLLLPKHVDTQEVLDAAAWAQARTKVFCTRTNNPTTKQIGSIVNHAYILNNLGYDRVSCNYASDSTSKIDASVLGREFTVNFDSPDSVITLKFKQLPGIPVETLTTSEKQGIDEKRANAYISVAKQSMYAEGFMSASLFFDERHAVDWLIAEIESNAFGYLLTRPTKVPATDPGGASIRQQVIRALDAGVRNGMMATGETSEGEFLANGYKTGILPVAQMSAADRAARKAPPITFTALLAGAFHSIQIDGVVER